MPLLLTACLGSALLPWVTRAEVSLVNLSNSTLLMESPIALPKLQEQLRTTGLVGEIHGSREDLALFVLTVRNPQNFFEYQHISLIAKTPETAADLSGLHRHDQVRVFGDFIENRSPQPHAEVTRLEIVRRYEPGTSMPDYSYETELPRDLPRDANGQGEATFLVHAVHAEGKILVLEYRDSIVPVFVRDGALTSGLYRNDLIRLAYRVQAEPQAPVHLRIRTDLPKPLELLESALAKHGKPADLTGALVLFPKSPQVSLDVYALHETIEGGATRQYTLVNFDSPDVFRAIREKLAAAWAQAPNEVRNGRNKLIHNRLRVRARGIFNCVDPNQANVQILLKSAEDLEVLF